MLARAGKAVVMRCKTATGRAAWRGFGLALMRAEPMRLSSGESDVDGEGIFIRFREIKKRATFL